MDFNDLIKTAHLKIIIVKPGHGGDALLLALQYFHRFMLSCKIDFPKIFDRFSLSIFNFLKIQNYLGGGPQS